MNKFDDQLERLIHQSIQEDFHNVPDLHSSKEKTWNEISKQLPQSGKRLFPNKSMMLMAGLLALFIIGASYTDVPSTKAFGWIKEFFMFKQDTTLYMGSGSSPVDDSGKKPPSSEEFVVLESVNKTLTVTSSEAQEMASFGLLLPTYLPNGYSEKEAVVQCADDRCDNVTLTYTNKKGKELRIQQKHFSGVYGAGRGFSNVIETKEVEIKGVNATLVITSHENLKFVVWSNYNTEFLIDAYLSDDEILRVAESLE